jgi:hypothetical protein
MSTRAVLVVLVLCLCLGFSAPAVSAQDPLSSAADAAGEIAKRIRRVVGNQREVFVRPFRAPASSNVAIAKSVADALAELGLTNRPGAPIEIEGRLSRIDDEFAPIDESSREEFPVLSYRVTVTVVFPSGRDHRFSVDVQNGNEGTLFLGETGEKNPPPVDMDTLIARAGRSGGKVTVAKPTIEGTKVLASPECPFAVEILVERGAGRYEARRPRMRNGLVFVDLNLNDIYAVKVYNRSQYEAVASVHIDGLSRFALSDDPRLRDNRDLIGGNAQRTISGYYRSQRSVDAFQVGRYSESLAARMMADPADIGVIAVQFFAAWREGEQPPPFERETVRMVERIYEYEGKRVKRYVPVMSTREIATKPGPARVDRTRSVKRNIGKLRALIKVRYAL